MLALQFQLGQSQWWPEEVVRELQTHQLAIVLEHAYRTVSWYRKRIERTGLPPAELAKRENWNRLPLVTRRDFQAAGCALHSSERLEGHGGVYRKFTGGATGQPVMTLGTDVTEFFWQAITLRDHLWHRRDLSKKLAVIRYAPSEMANPPDGTLLENWGPATDLVTKTGECVLLSVASTVDEQVCWLKHHDPGYLLTYPSVANALAKRFVCRRDKLAGLREVRTFGEVLEPKVRDACRKAWDVPVVDIYSAQEVGYIALQCPESNHYHVQSEDTLVEILDDSNEPCRPGQVGRVILSSLHNLAMPILRYEVGDYAEVGEPCKCGRGLPVLTRIMGRQRNMFVLPGGIERWPSLEFDGALALDDLPPVSQFQVVQRKPTGIEVRLVAARSLTKKEEAKLRANVERWLGYPFEVAFKYVDEIERSPTGKFEDFCCDLTSANVVN